jgi:hypothetical protein
MSTTISYMSLRAPGERVEASLNGDVQALLDNIVFHLEEVSCPRRDVAQELTEPLVRMRVPQTTEFLDYVLNPIRVSHFGSSMR